MTIHICPVLQYGDYMIISSNYKWQDCNYFCAAITEVHSKYDGLSLKKMPDQICCPYHLNDNGGHAVSGQKLNSATKDTWWDQWNGLC